MVDSFLLKGAMRTIEVDLAREIEKVLTAKGDWDTTDAGVPCGARRARRMSARAADSSKTFPPSKGRRKRIERPSYLYFFLLLVVHTKKALFFYFCYKCSIRIQPST